MVTAIAGATRMRLNVTGLAGHAGTVPMGAQRDALTAAAEMILLVERYCTENAGLVGTVGKLNGQTRRHQRHSAGCGVHHRRSLRHRQHSALQPSLRSK